MSTDLEFLRDLLEIRLPTINITSSHISTYDTKNKIQEEKVIIEHDDQDECQTPKSPQHMIPKILSCPPAPKKLKPVASRKRKLCQRQFFEAVAREEVESFFRSSFVLVDENSDGFMKRRCVV